jgi:peptide/nickel transport system substrate-binding protein
MKKHFRLLLLLILVLVLMPMAACQVSEEGTPDSSGQTGAPLDETEAPMEATEEAIAEPLIVLIDNDEGPITPANANTFIGGWMTGWIYDPLYIRTPDLGTVPHLATSATPSEDGLTWSINLRDDVRWHDGEPFTAEDVVFAYNFLIEAGRAPGLVNVESITADGDYALTIVLSAPNPFFLEEGLAATYVMPEHIWRDQVPVSGELSQFQGKIGTGAYKLVDVVPGESYTFEANSDYFLTEPTVPSIIAKIVKDPWWSSSKPTRTSPWPRDPISSITFSMPMVLWLLSTSPRCARLFHWPSTAKRWSISYF